MADIGEFPSPRDLEEMPDFINAMEERPRSIPAPVHEELPLEFDGPRVLPPMSVPTGASVASACPGLSTRPEQDEGDWSGRVAAERPEGPFLDRLPPSEVLPRSGSGGIAGEASTGLPAARLQLSVAMQALDACAAQLRRVSDHDQQLGRSAMDFASLTAEAQGARAEADGLRRDIQRLRGLPRELMLLSNNDLHALQQDLAEALRNVHGELENRSKCCVCRAQEREMVLHPCMHLVLCRACSCRVTSCPLCRRRIESSAPVRVA